MENTFYPKPSDAEKVQLILASSSSARKQLLSQLNIPFIAISPNIDETPMPEEIGIQLALRLGMQKAEKLAEKYPRHWIIGSDQVCTLDQKIIAKPQSLEEAEEQLNAFSGQLVDFYTAISLFNWYSQQSFQNVVTTKVVFKPLSSTRIKEYVKQDQPLGCAGSFKVEQLGISLFSKIQSDDPSALQGLPLISLSQFLEDVHLLKK